MAKITGFQCVDEAGFPVLADPWGNNVAFRCLSCGGPVLAVVREHQRGFSKESPAECRACRCQFWICADEDAKKLTVMRVR